MAPQGAPSADRAEHSVEPLRVLHPDARSLPRRALPARQTSFVGRVQELAELSQLLAAPDCRLLTIIGPGGIGKTRLAVEAAESIREMFPDGIAFAPMQSVSAVESVAPALAAAIGHSLTGHGDARDQVVRYLRQARLLLIIDNFEHLLEEAPWIGELLDEAPGLRVLVTSREALNLREEWRYPLAGLEVPDDKVDDPDQSEAVRLFVERARQARREFQFESDRDGVIRLCRIVEGFPLALELAAAWINTLSPADIASEIERNIAFLATDLRNVPARHRSMQAAFDYSWALLTDDERHVFQHLAVFRGGFSRDAAEQVAGATLPLVSSLVDKSLVRRRVDGRFFLHELLRQYADEHLRADPEEAARIIAGHREFYLAFVAARCESITGGEQRAAIAEIAAEIDNISAAWQGAVAAGEAEALGRVAHTLALFFDFRARYREGLTLLEEGLRVLRAAVPAPAIDRAIAAMLVDIVRLNHRLTQLPAMRAALAEAEVRYAGLSGPPPRGQMTDPRLWRALLALIDGHYAEAARLSAESVQRNIADDRPGNLPFAWWIRTAAALWQEDVAVADESARRCIDAALANGDRWHLAYGHNLRGHVAVALGNYAEARRHYEASYTIREELDDPEGMGTGLTHLANVAALQGDLVEAERLYRSSIALAGEIGDQITIANALNGLGRTACITGDYGTAGQYLAQGLRMMAEVRLMRLLLAFLVSAGDWLLQTGNPAEAVGPLALAHAHSGSDRDTRARVQPLLAAVASLLPPEVYAALVESNRNADPADLATRLIPMLTAPLATAPAPSLRAEQGDEDAGASLSTASPAPAAAGTLVEPLTERELAVLRLIAAGHSNREIADELFLSVNTVRSYNQQIYGKLGIGSRTQAVARARDLGLI
jgi:predicted ATPase/DNA-binding CsgD family transcriptional regulator